MYFPALALPQTHPGTVTQFPQLKIATSWKTPHFLFHSYSFSFAMRKPGDTSIPTHKSTWPSRTQTLRRGKHSKKETKQGRKTSTTGVGDKKRGNRAYEPEEKSFFSFQPLPAQHRARCSQKSLLPNTVSALQVPVGGRSAWCPWNRTAAVGTG